MDNLIGIKNDNDKRSELMMEYLRLVEYLNSIIVLVDNVDRAV